MYVCVLDKTRLIFSRINGPNSALVQFQFSVLFCQDFLPLESLWLHFRINMKTQRSLVSSLRGIVLVLTWQIIYEGMNERFEAVLIIIEGGGALLGPTNA